MDGVLGAVIYLDASEDRDDGGIVFMNVILESIFKRGNALFNIDNQGIAFCIGEYSHDFVPYYLFLTAKHCVPYEEVFFHNLNVFSSDYQCPLKIAVALKPSKNTYATKRLVSVDLVVKHPHLDIAVIFLAKRERYNLIIYNPSEIINTSSQYQLRGAEHVVYDREKVNFITKQEPVKILHVEDDGRIILTKNFGGGWSGSPLVNMVKGNKVIGIFTKSIPQSEHECGTVFPIDRKITSWVEKTREKFNNNFLVKAHSPHFFC